MTWLIDFCQPFTQYAVISLDTVHCLTRNLKIVQYSDGCRAQSVLIQICVCTAAVTLERRTEWRAFLDLQRVSPTLGSNILGNLELMQINWGTYLVQLADPAVMRLVHKISK